MMYLVMVWLLSWKINWLRLPLIKKFGIRKNYDRSSGIKEKIGGHDGR